MKDVVERLTTARKSRYTMSPKAYAARLKGVVARQAKVRLINDRTSVSIDKEVKNRAIEGFGSVSAAVLFALEAKEKGNK